MKESSVPSSPDRASSRDVAQDRVAVPLAGVGRPAGLFTWVAVGLVAAVIVTIVAIKIFSPGVATTVDKSFQPTPAAVLAQLTHVPIATFNSVGVTSPAIPVSVPLALSGQPALLWPDRHGVVRPTVFFFGAEYCPMCAAERWPLILALSRFGTFTHLGNTTSSSIDIYKNTPTFTFRKSTFASPYVNFFPVERDSNILANTPSGYTPLMALTRAEQRDVATYDNATYFAGLGGGGSLPSFLSINNHFFVAGANFPPSALAGEDRSHVAAGLADPNNRLTDGIVAAANLLTAAICVETKAQPIVVCRSPAVTRANRALGLSPAH